MRHPWLACHCCWAQLLMVPNGLHCPSPPAAARLWQNPRMASAAACGHGTWAAALRSSAASGWGGVLPARAGWVIVQQQLTQEAVAALIRACALLPAAATRASMGSTSRRATQQSSSRACGKCQVSPPAQLRCREQIACTAERDANDLWHVAVHGSTLLRRLFPPVDTAALQSGGSPSWAGRTRWTQASSMVRTRAETAGRNALWHRADVSAVCSYMMGHGISTGR